MQFSWHRFAHLALASAAALALAACGGGTDNAPAASSNGTAAAQPVTLRLGYFPNMTHAQPLVGLARGTFAEELGGNVKVETKTFNAGPAVIEALFAGAIDIASGGVPGLITIWAKTWKTPQEVRGVSGLSQQPVYLTSRDPSIRSIRDFKPTDRIALPAVKVSAQAVWLQMAAAKEWGDEHFDRLDALKEQRVNQTAHLILAQALGVRLRAHLGASPLEQLLPALPADEMPPVPEVGGPPQPVDARFRDALRQAFACCTLGRLTSCPIGYSPYTTGTPPSASSFFASAWSYFTHFWVSAGIFVTSSFQLG